MPDLIGPPRQLLGRQYRQDDLATQLLEVALVIGGGGLDENLITPKCRRRLGVKLALYGAPTRNLDDESRLLRHRARLDDGGPPFQLARLVVSMASGLKGALAGGLVLFGLMAAPAAAKVPRVRRHTAAPVVSVFPIPGDRVASPQTQIAFRGVAASMLGRVRVVGSLSRRHTGRIEADSDGKGASFLPNKTFSPGETVTVSTWDAILLPSQDKFLVTN